MKTGENKRQSKITGVILNTKGDDVLPCTDEKLTNTTNRPLISNQKENSDEELDLKLAQTVDDVDELDEEEEDERNEEK